MQSSKRVVVIGASGGTGRAAVERLLETGHRVTAFARRASAMQLDSERLTKVDGDVLQGAALGRAMQGQEAVVVTLGIRENPLRVRLFGSASTSLQVRSAGTAAVIRAMHQHGVRRLIVQSSYGVGASRERLRWIDRQVFRWLLKPQIQDTELQERLVKASGLDWVLAQPVHLTDALESGLPFSSHAGEVKGWSVSRGRVASFLAQAVGDSSFLGQTLALSGGQSA